MRYLVLLFIHFLVTIARLFGPGGARSVVAESLLTKHQLLIFSRSTKRAPRLRPSDRIIVGLCATLMRPTHLLRLAISLKPSTILSFHRALANRKYRLLFTSKNRRKPGPRGPSPALIEIIVEMKHRNPRFGYQRIADQVALVFDIDVDKARSAPCASTALPAWLWIQRPVLAHVSRPQQRQFMECRSLSL